MPAPPSAPSRAAWLQPRPVLKSYSLSMCPYHPGLASRRSVTFPLKKPGRWGGAAAPPSPPSPTREVGQASYVWRPPMCLQTRVVGPGHWPGLCPAGGSIIAKKHCQILELPGQVRQEVARGPFRCYNVDSVLQCGPHSSSGFFANSRKINSRKSSSSSHVTNNTAQKGEGEK